MNAEPMKAELQADIAATNGETKLTPEELESFTEKLVKALKSVYDPEIPVDIYELGLIYKVDVADNYDTTVDMTLTAPGCGMGPMLAQDVQNKLLGLEGVDDVAVELVWDPPWNQAMMTEAAKLQLGLL